MEFFAFDASYVEKLRSGDTHIEGHFVSYFSELIRLKLRSRLNSREAIEDVRQETFMRVLALLRAEEGLRQPDRLGPFVNSVCNHVLLEHYRSQKTSDRRPSMTKRRLPLPPANQARSACLRPRIPSEWFGRSLTS